MRIKWHIFIVLALVFCFVMGAMEGIAFAKTQKKQNIPKTGKIISGSTQSGYGELSIHAGDLQSDAVVALVPVGQNVAIISIYIRRGDKYALKGITDGVYYLYYKTGENWDGKKKNFLLNVQSYRCESTLTFVTTFEYGNQNTSLNQIQFINRPKLNTSYTYTIYEVVLKENKTPNEELLYVSEKDFPLLL